MDEMNTKKQIILVGTDNFGIFSFIAILQKLIYGYIQTGYW